MPWGPNVGETAARRDSATVATRERDTGDGDGTPPPPKVDRGIVDAATPAAAPRGSGEWDNNDGREQSGKLGA